MPLLQLDIETPPYTRTAEPMFSPGEDEETPSKRWWHYLPLCVTVILILAPHPSLLITLVAYYLQAQHAPLAFAASLLVAYVLTALAFSSLIVCVARDPGPVGGARGPHGDSAGENRETSLTEALMAPEEDFSAPGKWCRKCWAPKPERTHHCSICGRCVLKMDHHCPWLASKCVGHWTYPAFLHFTLSVSLLALYIAVLCTRIVWVAFLDPLHVSEIAAIHALFLAVIGWIFAVTMGSFFLYHVYLVTTNQTTIESLAPFLLLRHLTPLPPHPPDGPGARLSDPPMEHELSAAQRRHVRRAHSAIRLYDVGWRRNWAQVIGWKRRWGWAPRILYGGGGFIDGRSFPRNARADELLRRLASELIDGDKMS